MLGAGERDRRIRILRATTAPDEHNQPVAVWSDIGGAWAKVRYGTGSERRTAAQDVAEQPATFIVLASTTTRSITVLDRIAYDGLEWDIRGIAKHTRAEIEITALARAPA